MLVAFTGRAQVHAPRSFIYGGGSNIVAYGGGALPGYGLTNSYILGGQWIGGTYDPTEVTNTVAIADVPLWINRDGTTANAAIAVDFVETALAPSNNWTFTFAALPIPGVVATETQNKFVFTINGNGTTKVVLSTNLPTSVLQGAYGLRLLTCTPSASATTNTTFHGIYLIGGPP